MDNTLNKKSTNLELEVRETSFSVGGPPTIENGIEGVSKQKSDNRKSIAEGVGFYNITASVDATKSHAGRNDGFTAHKAATRRSSAEVARTQDDIMDELKIVGLNSDTHAWQIAKALLDTCRFGVLPSGRSFEDGKTYGLWLYNAYMEVTRQRNKLEKLGYIELLGKDVPSLVGNGTVECFRITERGIQAPSQSSQLDLDLKFADAL
jgi:hypothetical protein